MSNFDIFGNKYKFSDGLLTPADNRKNPEIIPFKYYPGINVYFIILSEKLSIGSYRCIMLQLKSSGNYEALQEWTVCSGTVIDFDSYVKCWMFSSEGSVSFIMRFSDKIRIMSCEPFYHKDIYTIDGNFSKVRALSDRYFLALTNLGTLMMYGAYYDTIIKQTISHDATDFECLTFGTDRNNYKFKIYIIGKDKKLKFIEETHGIEKRIPLKSRSNPISSENLIDKDVIKINKQDNKVTVYHDHEQTEYSV